MLKKKKWCTKVCSSVCSPHFRPLLLRNLSVPALSIMVAANWELVGKFSTQNTQPRRGRVFGDCVGLTREGRKSTGTCFFQRKKEKKWGERAVVWKSWPWEDRAATEWLLGAGVPSRNWDLSWLQSGGEPGTLCWAESLNGIKWLTVTLEDIACMRNSHLRLHPYNHISHTTI